MGMTMRELGLIVAYTAVNSIKQRSQTSSQRENMNLVWSIPVVFQGLPALQQANHGNNSDQSGSINTKSMPVCVRMQT